MANIIRRATRYTNRIDRMFILYNTETRCCGLWEPNHLSNNLSIWYRIFKFKKKRSQEHYGKTG
ncbi:Uncharacterised protein [Vibrio cholerae]|nr:Uncharacterised protein [Vibrio cholerae]